MPEARPTYFYNKQILGKITSILVESIKNATALRKFSSDYRSKSHSKSGLPSMSRRLGHPEKRSRSRPVEGGDRPSAMPHFSPAAWRALPLRILKASRSHGFLHTAALFFAWIYRKSVSKDEPSKGVWSHIHNVLTS
jgi:hypothetical protein